MAMGRKMLPITEMFKTLGGAGLGALGGKVWKIWEF